MRRPVSIRRRWRVVGLGLVAVLSLATIADYFCFPWGKPISAPIEDRGTNGLWLRYTHYFGEKSDAETKALARNLKTRRIRWAYFHVRETTKEGTLRFHRLSEARRLLAEARRETPNLHCLAWVSIESATTDLAQPEVRKRLTREARWLVESCGFDGVQWDYETCPSGNEGLSKLLSETRAVLPNGKMLGVCAPAWLPFGDRFSWSEDYISDVAARCDQVAVMCYDTGFVTPRAYVWLTRQNVVRFTRAVRKGNPKGTVMLGVPTYGPALRSHNPRAENLENALRGVREGLADSSVAQETFAGVAPFADYTTDDREWATWKRDWLGVR